KPPRDELGGRRGVAREIDAVAADGLPLVRGRDHLDLVEVDGAGRHFFRPAHGEGHLAARPPGGQNERESSAAPPLEELHGMPSRIDRNTNSVKSQRRSHSSRRFPQRPLDAGVRSGFNIYSRTPSAVPDAEVRSFGGNARLGSVPDWTDDFSRQQTRYP